MPTWKKCKLRDAISVNPTVSLKGGKEYSFIEMADLSNGQKFAYPSVKRVLTGGARFQEGDTLFARITPCLENGKICQVKELENGVGFGSTEFFVLRGKEDVSNTDYVFYLSRWDYVRKYAEQNLVGTSGRQRVSADVFAELEIPLPDLPIQTRIASILSALDDKIELNRQMNQTLEQMAQALFKKYFVDDIDADNLPKGWRWGKLGEMFEITMGQSPDGKSYNQTKIGTPFFQGRTDFNNRFPSNRVYTTEPTRFAKPQDVLMSVRAPVGDINISLNDCCIGRGVASIRSKNGNSSFCFYKMENLKEEFDRYNGEGTVFGSINKEELSNMKAVIPSDTVVAEFEKYVLAIDKKIKNNYLESENLKTIRDTLLPKLMSGEIEVNAEIENEIFS